MSYFRVSMDAVNRCKNSVKEIAGKDPMFSSAFQTLTGLRQSLLQFNEELTEKINRLRDVADHLESSIRDLDDEIDTCKENIKSLREQKTAYRNLLDGNNDEGIKYLLSQINSEIADEKENLSQLRAEIDESENVLRRVKSMISSLTNNQNSIESEISMVEEIFGAIEDVQRESRSAAESVISSLTKINSLINQYLRTRVELSGFSLGDTSVMQISPAGGHQVQKSDTQFEKISLKSEDHQIELDDNGRITSYDGKSFGGVYRSYVDRLNCTSAESWSLGHYEGAKGESKYIPSAYSAKGLKVIEILKDFGLDGIEYRNAEPDFEVCCVTSLKISDMTDDRESNFASADKELAKLWNEEGREGKTDWRQKDIKEYRTKNLLTWHEKCDTETMVLVRREINLYFKHSGGVSECAARDAMGNIEGGFDE